jgi:hypothetical protein
MDDYKKWQVLRMTNSQKMVAYCKEQLGSPYVFGARGQKCTPSYRGGISQSTKDAHTTIVSKCQVLTGKSKYCAGCEFEGKLCFDCRGLTYCAAKEAGLSLMGAGATSQWNDESNWAQKGVISDMPDKPCCVYRKNGSKMEHTALYIGNGEFIEAGAGVRQRKMTDYKWTHYGILKGMYEDMPETPQEAPEATEPTLRLGGKGEEVKMLQNLLNQHGAGLNVDGKFGPLTKKAVEKYQTDNGLTVDGIVGKQTWGELTADIQPPEPPEAEEPQEDTAWDITIRGLTTEERDELLARYPNMTYVKQS